MPHTAITPEAANHVLHHAGHGGYPAGHFDRLIIRALDIADEANFHTLADAFPALGGAMAALQYDPDGIANLQRIAGSVR